MKVYLAGPMSDIPQFNIPAFKEATRVLRERGFVVISPVELDGEDDEAILMESTTGSHADLPRPYDEYLSADHEVIRSEPGLEAIVTLPGWALSSGARSEVQVGYERGLPRYDYDPHFGVDLLHFYDADGRFILHAENPLRQRSSSGGVKDNRGKLPIDLIPYDALAGAAAVLEYGTRKYKPNNWRLGLSWTQTWSSLQRHLWAWKEGEDLDPETGLPHLDHAMCQMLFLATYFHDPAMKVHDDRWASTDKEDAKA